MQDALDDAITAHCTLSIFQPFEDGCLGLHAEGSSDLEPDVTLAFELVDGPALFCNDISKDTLGCLGHLEQINA